MAPPNGDLTYLADTGRAIYKGLAQTDPKAVWLLQGWTFMNQERFWRQDRVKAFLDAVPDEQMLVIDLFCEPRDGLEQDARLLRQTVDLVVRL